MTGDPQIHDLNAPLFGRDAEMATLKRALDDAIAGQARIVTVLGGPGSGKTRLLQDFFKEIGSAGTKLRVYRGDSRLSTAGYATFARLLRSRFQLVEGMDPESARAQMRSQVALVLEDRKVGDVCHFLGQYMELTFQDSPMTKALDGDPLEARLIRRAILKSFIESDAARQTVCLVFDDLASADEDSLELLRYLIQNLGGRVLILCAARAELLARHEDWAAFGDGRHERLELGPLASDEAEQLVRALLAPCQGGVPEQLVEAALDMAGGTPGLLTQMIRIFHDSAVLAPLAGTKSTRWQVNLERLDNVRLPMTVDDAVAARIAALSTAERRVLEHAAAMGSVFWLGGLVALARMDREAPVFWHPSEEDELSVLGALLDDLTSRDYVLKLPDSTLVDDTEYVFKHNLEREKITKLTSAAAARRYHQTLADWLSQKECPGAQEEYIAMLAAHLEQAGSLTRAGGLYLSAGDLARQSYAAKKAHEFYQRGLGLLGDDDARRRIDALHNHGDVLQLVGKTDEALAAFREMQALAYRLALHAKGGAAHNRIGRLFRETGSLSEADKNLKTALELFTLAGDERGVAACTDDIGKLLWVKGEYEEALEELKRSLEKRKALGDRRSIALSFNNIGLVWMDHGSRTRAREAFEAALTLRREIGDVLGVSQSLNNLGRLAQEQGDLARALELYREAYDAAREVGERNRITVILTNIGETHYRMGNTAEAIRILKEAEELCDELGDKLHLAEAKRGLAKAYLTQNELRKARESIKHAVDLFGQVRSKAHLAVALRTLGEITAAGAWGAGHEGKAVDYFMRSIAICKEIGNELEVAKSYRAFSEYVSHSPHYKDNGDIQREAHKLSAMADEIFERHRQQLAARA